MDLANWNYEEDLEQLKANLGSIAASDPGNSKAWARELIIFLLKLTTPADEKIESKDAETDPLKIPHILDKVMENLPRSSLKNTRLVSQSWNTSATKSLRQQNYKHLKVPPDNFLKFFEAFDKCKLFPFTKLRVNLDSMCEEHCSQFFAKHGPAIEDLRIREVDTDKWDDEDGDAPESQECLERLQFILKNLPNLKALTLYMIYINDIIPRGNFIFDEKELKHINLSKVESLYISPTVELSKNFLDGLFTMLPNIKSFDLGSYRARVNRFTYRFQDYEVLVSALHRLRSLHSLNVPSDDMKSYSWTALLGLQNLKEFYLDLDGSCSVEKMEFLRCQSGSLEKLSITDYYCRKPEDPKLDLPVMKKLRSLSFNTCNIWERVPFIVSISFIKPCQVPCMKILRINPTVITKVFGDFPFENVGEWDFIGVLPTGSRSLLLQIQSRFPNLRKITNLGTNLNDRDMNLIASSFQNVEDLHLRVMECFRHSSIRNSARVLSHMMNIIEAPSILTVARAAAEASLFDLTCLKKLELDFNFDSEADGREENFVRIDEISANFLFLRLSSQLRLTLRGDFLISDDLAAKMTAHYQNIYFVPNEVRVKLCGMCRR